MVTIRFSTANDAFTEPGPEIARILRTLAKAWADLEQMATKDERAIMDANGNRIGTATYTSN